MPFLAALMRCADQHASSRWQDILGQHQRSSLRLAGDDRRLTFEVVSTIGSTGKRGSSVAVGPESVVTGTIFTVGDDELVPIGQLVHQEIATRILETSGSYASERFWGHYSGVFFDPRTGRLLALRDPTGGEALFRWCDPSGLMLFSDSLALMLDAIGGKLNVDRKLLALNLAYGNGLPNRRTAFEGITALLPGECFLIDGPTGAETADLPWWRRAAEGPTSRGALDEVLESAVRARLKVDGKISLQLSGGLDSSVLLGLIAKLGKQAQVHCLSYFRTGGTMDERTYVQMAAEHAKADLTEVDVANLKYPVELADRYRFTPRPHARVLFDQLGEAFDSESLAAGCDTYWVGYGGDMMFSNYPASHLIIDAWREGGLSHFLNTAVEIALYQEKALWRIFWEALVYPPPRTAAQQWVGMKENWKANDEDLANADNGAFELIDRCFASVSSPGHRQRLYDVYYDMWQSSEQKVYYGAGGVDYVRPYYSEPVMAAVFNIPPSETIRFGLNRFPQRALLAKLMPPKMSTRISKGGADDQTYRALRADAEAFERILRNGHLAAMDLIGANECRVDMGTIELGKAHKNFAILNTLANEVWLRGHEDVLNF